LGGWWDGGGGLCSSLKDTAGCKFVDMTEWMMRQRFGDEKTDHFLASGMLKQKPCRVTGSLDPKFCEYEVPDAIKVVTDTSTDGIRGSSVVDGLSKADEKNIESLRPEMGLSSSSNDASSGGVQPDGGSKAKGPKVKEEPLSETEQTAKKAKHFQEHPQEYLNKLQVASTEAKSMFAQAQGKRFAESFAQEARDHSKRLDRSTALVSKVVLGQSMVPAQVPKMVLLVEKQLEETESLKRTALGSFGINIGMKKRRTKAAAK